MKVIEEVNIDVNSELRDIENFLRDNIAFILKNNYGKEWEKKLGVTGERINTWETRKIVEQKRLNGKKLEDRLLYYSDFYDLKVIIDKNWNVFKDVFLSKKEIDYQLEQLESYRNPNAHNRDLLEHQKFLLRGIVGEIKSNLMKYKGKIEKVETYFLSVDSININGEIYKGNVVNLATPLRIGDKLDISIYISAPPNQKIFYAIDGKELLWKESSHFLIELEAGDLVGKKDVLIYIKSDQIYHKYNKTITYDDAIIISFIILPK